MAQSDFIAVAALIVSVISFFLQFRHTTEQRQIDAEMRVKETNRELITLGFSHPELFKVMDDQPASPRLERAYLQLWLNFYEQIFLDRRRGLFSREFFDGLQRDMQEIFSQRNMQRHWHAHKIYYQTPFQTFGNSLLPREPFLPVEKTGAHGS